MPLTGPLKFMAAWVALLHNTLLDGILMDGKGFTAILKVFTVPVQLLAAGLTVMMAVSGILVVFTAVKDAILPVPVDARPMAGILLVQL